MSQVIDPALLERVAEEFPHHRGAALRLAGLIEDPLPTVTVLGKYNHGKSSLLNVVLGAPCFAVSDKRETRCNQIVERAGLRLIDTPGLDADSAGEDDRKAIEAATRDSDLRLFVHAIDQGELDRGEAGLIAQLQHEESETGRAFLLVLTRIDKATADDRRLIVEAIRCQAPQARVLAVSANAWIRGQEEGKPALQSLGNIDTLKSEIEQAVSTAFAARTAEGTHLAQGISASVEGALAHVRGKLDYLRDSRQRTLDMLTSSLGMPLTKLKLELMIETMGD